MVANQFAELFSLIEECWEISEGEASAGITVPLTTWTESRHSGPGHPRKEIDPEVLQEAYRNGQNILITMLAQVLQINRKTLRKRLNELDIDTGYSLISDADLDLLVKQYHNKLGHGIKQSRLQKKARQKYRVPRPNALWHIDGHHKLIHWGIVIHGIADGYSRTVTGLRASTNNSADTVLNMFIEAITTHGVPSRVRGDRGGENRDVAILMILLRGLNRASFMWGPSVFNTRIEQMWVELGERLENQHLLQRTNPEHRWLLQYLFLDLINEDCDNFCLEWNAHGISSAGGRSPNEMVLLGKLEHGFYDDECHNLTEDEVYKFYGFEESNSTENEEEENGLDMDEDEDFNEEFDPEQIIDSNIRYDAVPVPSSDCPLTTDGFTLFQRGLQALKEGGDVPNGYGATEEELGDNGFDEHEDIVIGIQHQAFAIQLPQEHSSRNGKTKAAPKIKTGTRSARVRSSEEPTSPNPRPSKIAHRSGSGMSRLEDILAGSSLGARASQEATSGRGRGGRGLSTRLFSKSRKEKSQINQLQLILPVQDAPLSIDLDTIVVLPYGVVESPDSESDSESGDLSAAYVLPPGQVVDFSAGGISRLKQRGLCAIDHSSGFTFHVSETHGKVTSTLRAALPRLFKYLDQCELEAPDDDSDPESAFLSSWLVCTRRSWNTTTLDVFSDDVKSPDGREIVDTMIASAGKAKAAAKDRVLFLITRYRIPKDVLNSWKPRTRQLGSVTVSALSTHTARKSAHVPINSEDEAESAATTDSGEDNDAATGNDADNGRRGEGEETNNDEREVNEIISVSDSSDDGLPGPTARVTRATTVPAEERDDEAFLASFDFSNDPRNPHINRT
ncbi:hypothetical protein D9619_012711 [Psilocybe cf. subviscida]|uniref:Integrase catalytic domain-containing protein n=1 Tax=Psilocybe cf. subviscida TaxID=2480587 RepID=A0A8H5ER46_9AGAR|nr:hypothetical protein D9619_012711 [Psilocybe cf. subviscida]